MPNSLPSWIAGSFLVLCSLSPLESVSAQAQLAADSLKSEIYFGSRTADGQTVGERAWEEFVAQVIAPRFTAGLTILEGRGRSGATAELGRVWVLVLVHPNSSDAQARLGEIKTEYKKRFGSVGIFHTDQLIRTHAAD
jgi:uncharacterized protein DUF3574